MRRAKGKSRQAVGQAVAEEVAEGSDSGLTGTVFDSIRDDAYVMVWRRNEASKRMVYMGRLAPSEATEEVLQRQLGGGYYTLREKIPNENGVMEFGRQRSFELGGPRKPNGTLEGVGELPQSPANAAPVPGAPASTGSDPRSFLDATMVTLFMDVAKAAREMKQPAATPDISIWLKPILDGQTKMMELLLNIVMNQSKGGGDSTKSALDMISKIRETFAPATAPNPGNPAEIMKNIVETIKQLRDVSDDINPKRETDPMDVLGRMAEVIVTEQAERRKGPPQRKLPPQPKGAPMPAVTDGAGRPLPPWQQILRKEAKRLLAQAQAGRDPDAVATLALEFAPANIRGILTEFFSQDSEVVMALIAENVPGIAEYPQWVQDFVLSAQDRLGLLDEEDGEGEGEPEPGQEGAESAEEGGDLNDSSEGS